MEITGSNETYYAKLQSAIGDKSVYVKHVTPSQSYFLGPNRLRK